MALVILHKIIIIFTTPCPIFYPQTVPSVLATVTLSLAVISVNRDGSYLTVHNVSVDFEIGYGDHMHRTVYAFSVIEPGYDSLQIEHELTYEHICIHPHHLVA